MRPQVPDVVRDVSSPFFISSNSFAVVLHVYCIIRKVLWPEISSNMIPGTDKAFIQCGQN